MHIASNIYMLHYNPGVKENVHFKPFLRFRFGDSDTAIPEIYLHPHTHRIRVWYIYLHLVNFMVNVGKYTIRGSYGIYIDV